MDLSQNASLGKCCAREHIRVFGEFSCELDAELDREMRALKFRIEDNTKKINKTLMAIKTSYWKDPKMKVAVDDAIQSNQKFGLL